MSVTGRPPKLTRTQVRYIRRAVKLRDRLSNKMLCRKFGISQTSLHNYICGNVKHECAEDFAAAKAKPLPSTARQKSALYSSWSRKRGGGL